MWKSEYGGRNFKKGGTKGDYPGQKGNKGIPPETPPSAGKQTKQVQFEGSKGDKGIGLASRKWGGKAPLD